jgi:hypothetical protein
MALEDVSVASAKTVRALSSLDQLEVDVQRVVNVGIILLEREKRRFSVAVELIAAGAESGDAVASEKSRMAYAVELNRINNLIDAIEEGHARILAIRARRTATGHA